MPADVPYHDIAKPMGKQPCECKVVDLDEARQIAVWLWLERPAVSVRIRRKLDEERTSVLDFTMSMEAAEVLGDLLGQAAARHANRVLLGIAEEKPDAP